MADIQRLQRGLIAADRAGDVNAARLFAQEIRKMQQGQGVSTQSQQQPPLSQEGIQQPTQSDIARQMGSDVVPIDLSDSAPVRPEKNINREISKNIRNIPVLGGAFTAAEDVGLGAAQILTNLGLSPQTGEAVNRFVREREETIDPRNEAARIAAGIAIPLPIGKGGALARVGKGAALGAATTPTVVEKGKEGDLMSFIQEKAIQAGTGLAVGGALEASPKLISGARNLFKKKPEVMTADEIRKASGALYQRAEQKGGTLTAETTNKFINDIQNLKPQTRAGQIVTGESEFTKVVDRFNDLRDQNITLAEAQELDEYLGELMDGLTDAGRLTKQGKKIFDIQTSLRNTIENVAESDVIGGKEGFAALKKARNLWSRSRKLADIERIIQRAENMEQPATAIKTGFRTLLNNPKRMRGFTKEEREAIKRASQSGVVQDVFRTFGSRLIPIVTGASTGGLGQTAAATLGSTASRSIGARIQADKAREVAEIVAGGSRRTSTPSLGLSAQTLGGINRGVLTATQDTGAQEQEIQQPSIRATNNQDNFNKAIDRFFDNTGETQNSNTPKKDFESRINDFFDSKEVNTEVNNNFTSQVIQAESSGDPNAQSKTSSASGLFQITDDTWKGLIDKYGDQEGVRLQDRGNPEAEKKMFDRLTEENKQSFMRGFKREPDNTELYAMHFLGAGAGKRLRKLLDKNPDKKAADIFKSAAKSNKSIFYKNKGRGAKRTIKEVYNILQQKVS